MRPPVFVAVRGGGNMSDHKDRFATDGEALNNRAEDQQS